jgi:putative membrane protein insertion efficiency factor
MGEFAKIVVLRMLRGYKWVISPLFAPACRYVPTCSEYAAEAVERYGAVRGGMMALWRVLRCHPFSRGGYDPVVNGQESHFSQKMREMGHPALPQGLKPNVSWSSAARLEAVPFPRSSASKNIASRASCDLRER